MFISHFENNKYTAVATTTTTITTEIQQYVLKYIHKYRHFTIIFWSSFVSIDSSRSIDMVHTVQCDWWMVCVCCVSIVCRLCLWNLIDTWRIHLNRQMHPVVFHIYIYSTGYRDCVFITELQHQIILDYLSVRCTYIVFSFPMISLAWRRCRWSTGAVLPSSHHLLRFGF